MTFTEGGTSLRPLLNLLVLLLELLDPARGVDQLLLAGEEGVAVRADGDLDLRNRRLGLEGVAAGALHGRLHVVRGDVFPHGAMAPLAGSSLTYSSIRGIPCSSSSWRSCPGGTPCFPPGRAGRGTSAGPRSSGGRSSPAGAPPSSSPP